MLHDVFMQHISTEKRDSITLIVIPLASPKDSFYNHYDTQLSDITFWMIPSNFLTPFMICV